MTIEEFYTKWRVRPTKAAVKVVNNPSMTESLKNYRIDTWEHSAPLGDFLRDYMDHRSISWWKRQWDWKIVNNLMVDVLNQMSITFVGNVP